MSSRIPALDGLRGVAILLVIVVHGWPELLPAGGYGVTVFFVLSGFLITGILLRDDKPDFKRFYWNRAVRLLPALVLVLTAYMLTYGHPEPAAWALSYAANIGTLLGNELGQLSHMWSLAVEEHFYLIWPLVVGFMPAARRTRITGWVLGIAITWRIVASVVLDFERVRFGTDTMAFALVAGCLLACLLAERRLVVPSRVATLVAVGGILAAAFMVPLRGVEFLWGEMAVVGLSMIAVAGCLQPVRLLENRTLVWFGTVSYGLYLWHVPVMWSGLAPMPVLGVVSILAAWASYRCVERPLRHRFHRSGNFLQWAERDDPVVASGLLRPAESYVGGR